MKKVRYGVVGLGNISQDAFLPGFKNAKHNSELTAFVSSDPKKLKTLGKKYGVEKLYSYDEFDIMLDADVVDALYIALPNDMHKDFVERALNAGIHVLCEKPLAVTASDCQSMINCAKDNVTKLMVAYRLHFEKANLEAINLLRAGKIGEPRLFNSVFTMNVKDLENYRLKEKHGGGTLYDIGIYCINAARYLFGAEPIDAFAWSTQKAGDQRFEEVDESTVSILRFPDECVASFTTSFGTEANDSFEVLGTKGSIKLSPAFGYSDDAVMEVTVNGKTKTKKFKVTDHFGPEVVYFSDCILKNKDIEPDGQEGFNDVRIIEALLESAEVGRPVSLEIRHTPMRPTLRQEITRPRQKPPEKLHARGASEPAK